MNHKLALVQLDLLGESPQSCLQTLQELVRRVEESGFESGFEAVEDTSPSRTFLVGVSVKLFKGAPTAWRDDATYSSRWGRDVRCPGSLRTMNAKRDVEFEAFARPDRRERHETDAILALEYAAETDLVPLLARLGEMSDRLMVTAVHEGAQGPGGRDPFGHVDGVNNLQQMQVDQPADYLRHVYTTDATGEIDGTYLSFRKYRCFPERFETDVLDIEDPRGLGTRHLPPDQVVGRSRETGLIVDEDGSQHPPEPDAAEARFAHPQSHIVKANPRGRGTTSFGHPVSVSDARIRRRSYPYGAPESEVGLLFLAFQANIQSSGFEFIHNEWLMSDFNGAPDPLLAPESGLVEPLTGCYYFVPRNQRDITCALIDMFGQETADEEAL